VERLQMPDKSAFESDYNCAVKVHQKLASCRYFPAWPENPGPSSGLPDQACPRLRSGVGQWRLVDKDFMQRLGLLNIVIVVW